MAVGGFTTRLSSTQKQSVLFFILSIGLFILIPLFWIPTWIPGGTGYQVLNQLGQIVGLENAVPVIGFPIGIYLGALIVWSFDYYRQWLGGWLLTNTLFFTAVTIWSGVGRPVQLDGPFQLMGLLIFLGMGLGMQVSGFSLQRLLSGVKPLTSKKRKRKYNWAILISVSLLSVSALTGVIDTYLRLGSRSTDLPGGTLLVLSIGLLCLYMPLILLLKSTETNRAVVLGPGRGGKTSILGGLAMAEDTYNENSAIQSIRDEEMERGYFPDRTGSNDVCEFSYTDEHGYFKRPQTLTTVDYPGEVLTGEPGENITLYDELKDIDRDTARSNGIFTYYRTRFEKIREMITEKLEGTYTDPWESIVEDIDDLGSEAKPSDIREHLAKLIYAADTIVFVIPGDDFLLKMIKSDIQDNRITVPDYHRGSIWYLDAKDDEEFSLRKLESDSTDGRTNYNLELDTESGRQQQLKPTTDEKEFNEIPVSDRLPDWRGHGQLGAVSAHYYYRTERERKHPREYLSVYKNLIEEPPDGFQFDLYDFVWVVAMSDLFIPEDSLLLGEFETNGREEIDRNINDYMAVSNYIQKVHLPGEDANPTTFQSYDIKACMEETGEEHIYPLWFKTFQEGNEIRFDTNVDRELVGSRMLLQRLAGQRKLQNLGANEEYVDDFVDSMREDLKDSEPDLEQED